MIFVLTKCFGFSFSLNVLESPEGVGWLDVVFPLTLTLSLGERGQPLDGCIKLAAPGAVDSQGLPKMQVGLTD
jgi:hypothetical protein